MPTSASKLLLFRYLLKSSLWWPPMVPRFVKRDIIAGSRRSRHHQTSWRTRQFIGNNFRFYHIMLSYESGSTLSKNKCLLNGAIFIIILLLWSQIIWGRHSMPLAFISFCHLSNLYSVFFLSYPLWHSPSIASLAYLDLLFTQHSVYAFF